MINLQIKKAKDIYHLNCPSSWDEVTVNQWVLMETEWNGSDLIHLISILTSMEIADLENAKSSLSNRLDDVIGYIVRDQPDFKKLGRKASITLDGVKIPMPKKLEQETFGQMTELYKLLENDKDMALNLPRIVAIYAQPKIDGLFNKDRIDEIELLVNAMPIIEAYPHCFFFYKRAKRYELTGMIS